MAIDPYSPCPGGTGKKIKFCCADLVGELDKVQHMLDGEQIAASLDYVRTLDDKYPGRACLQSMRVSLENLAGDPQKAEATLAAFIKRYPDNPVALAEQALATVSQGDAQAGIVYLQKSIEACGQEMPARVYDGIGALALFLVSTGHTVPGRAHLQLQLGIAQGRDERALSALLQLEGSPTIAIPLKDMPPLEEAPADAAWREPFQQAQEFAQRGYWKKAADGWTALTAQAGSSAALWRNLATILSYLADNVGAIEALRKYTSLGVPEDDAVEAEALAQSLSKAEAEGQVDELSVTYEIKSAEEVQEKLAADRHFDRLPLDTSPWTAQNEPPPRAGFSILDRPALHSGKEITREQVPHQLGQLLLFGKQTDREARLELILFRPELAATQKLLREALNDLLTNEPKELVAGQLGQVEHALSWHWRLPEDTPEELRLQLSLDQRRWLILEGWPKLPQPVFGGRSAEQASQEPQYRVRVLAGILLLQLSDADTAPEAYNELRRKLGLPEVGDLDAAGLDISKLPLARIWRLKPETLSDEQLQQAFNRAVVSAFSLALKRLAPEVLKRPDLSVVEYKLAAYRLLVRTATNGADAIRMIDEARKLAEAHKQSSAPWDLMELAHRIQRNEPQVVLQLIDHIQRQHGREPGVAQALVQLLMQTGLMGPDGRLAIGAPPAAGGGASSLVVPGASAEAGKLWTPDAPQPGGEKKSALWLPE